MKRKRRGGRRKRGEFHLGGLWLTSHPLKGRDIKGGGSNEKSKNSSPEQSTENEITQGTTERSQKDGKGSESCGIKKQQDVAFKEF